MNNTTQFFVSGSSAPFIADQYSSNNIFSFKSNPEFYGQGTIHLTSGSTNISGISTNFLDATTGRGLSYWFQFWVLDSSNNLYFVWINAITDNTHATILNHFNRSDLRINRNTSRGANWAGATGTYRYWIVKNWSDGIYSTALGNNAYAGQFAIAIGNGVAYGNGSCAIGNASVYNNANNSFGAGTVGVTGSTSAAFGNNNGCYGTSSFVAGDSNLVAIGSTYCTSFGQRSKVSGSGAFASGIGLTNKEVLASGTAAINFSQNNATQTAGRGAQGANTAILGGLNHHIPSTCSRTAILGGNLIVVGASVNDTVFMPKLRVGQGTGGALTTNSTQTKILIQNSATGELETVPITGLTTNVKLGTAGLGLYVKEGTNATSGIRTLTGGTAVVSTNKVTAISRIQLTSNVDGGTPGFVRVSARSAGASFTITSSNGSDTSQIAWFIVEPA